MMCYMSCHMLGMSSTLTNPALYGFLNHNLQMEIRRTVWDMRKYLGWHTISLIGNTVKIQTFGGQNKVMLDYIHFLFGHPANVSGEDAADKIQTIH